MTIAVYCAYPSEETLSYVAQVIDYLTRKNHKVLLIDRLEKKMRASQGTFSYFKSDEILPADVDYLFSVGGDGTFLRSVTVVRDSKIPILGINTGRLGFLTSLQKESLLKGMESLFKAQFDLISRSLLEVHTKHPVDALQDLGFALNEVSINRKNTTSMLSIEATLNDQPLTTYWSDGLIISTPTGSTGYSLSSGGPIVSPDSQCWILNPIAPHNINMRPLIVPDSTKISIKVTGRGTHHLVSLDSRILTLENGNDIVLKKAAFDIKTVQLQGDYFYNTLREKLFWGQDSRNTQ